MDMIDYENRAFLVYGAGFWGRGITLRKAAENCLKAGGRKSSDVSVKLVLGDKQPIITDSGNIEADRGARIILIGRFFKLGALLRLLSERINL